MKGLTDSRTPTPYVSKEVFICNCSVRRTRHHGAIAGKWSGPNKSAFVKIPVSTTVYMTPIL